MWELMRIGIEMQERMIETHAKGLEIMRAGFVAADRQMKVGTAMTGVGDAMNQAGQAQLDLARRWLRFWGGKP